MSKDKNPEEAIDELISELQNNPPYMKSQGLSAQPIRKPTSVPNIMGHELLEQYINTKAQESQDVLMQIILRLAQDAGDDPDKLTALSNLINNNTQILNMLNSRLIKTNDNATKVKIQELKNTKEKLKDVIETEGGVVSDRNSMMKNLFPSSNIREAEIEEH